jgi:SOS-response transcriptional repressor LexA
MDQGERLRRARIDAGFAGPSEAAQRFGWSPNTYKSNENGNATFSFKKATTYAKAFGVEPQWLYDGTGAQAPTEVPALPLQASTPGDPVNLQQLRDYIATQSAPKPVLQSGKLRPIERRIPVVGEVAAGLWRDAPVRQLEDVTEWLDLDVPGYERAVLKAMRVTGTSMNLVYPEGRYVVVAHPAEAGLRIGDYVVVQREKADLVEITLKEFVSENGRIALWPRSSDERYQVPIYLKDSDDSQEGITIIGVVVADYGRRARPPIAFERQVEP